MPAPRFTWTQKTKPALLLALVVLHSTAWVLLWQWQQQAVKQQAQLVLASRSSEVSTVTLHRSFFEQIKVKKHEIVLHGRLYDFKNLQSVGDSVTMELYHDRHEERLYSLLRQFFSNDSSGNGLVPTLLVHCLFTPFDLPEIPCISEPQLVISDHIEQCFSAQKLMPQNTPDSLFSPPDFCG